MSCVLLTWMSDSSLLDKSCWRLINYLFFSARYECFHPKYYQRRPESDLALSIKIPLGVMNLEVKYG